MAFLWGVQGPLPMGDRIVFGHPIITFDKKKAYYAPHSMTWKQYGVQELTEVWDTDECFRFPEGIEISEREGILMLGRAFFIEHERLDFPEYDKFEKIGRYSYHWRKCTMDDWREIYQPNTSGHRWFRTPEEREAYDKRREIFWNEVREDKANG